MTPTRAARGTPDAPIRVVVADDHAVVREGIRHVLAADPGFVVVGEAASAAGALALAGEARPDVVVLDVTMPGGSGLDVVPALREAAPGARVLVLSVHDHAEYVARSERVGAHGYLRKDTSPVELRDAIRRVHAGERFFASPSAAPAAVEPAAAGARQRAGERSPLDLLTARETDVLRGIADGLTNKEIAAQHGISTRTVESHRESLMRKLGIRSVAGLTKLAVESGLTSI